MIDNSTCRGIIRNGFHCLCWRSTRKHPSGLCFRHRSVVKALSLADKKKNLEFLYRHLFERGE